MNTNELYQPQLPDWFEKSALSEAAIEDLLSLPVRRRRPEEAPGASKIRL